MIGRQAKKKCSILVLLCCVFSIMCHSGRCQSKSNSLPVLHAPTNSSVVVKPSASDAVPTLSELATLVAVGEKDWLVVTPDGLFDGSPAAWKQVLWRFSPALFDVLPVEAFYNEFYYPGLLDQIMAGHVPAAPSNINDRDRRQPTVSLAAGHVRQPNGAIGARSVTIDVTVAEVRPDTKHHAGSGALDLRLFRNGVLIRRWHGDVLKGSTKVVIPTVVPIVAGENQFTAYAFNSQDIKSDDATLSLTGDKSLERGSSAYIIVVGINNYANTEYNLTYANPDAVTIGDRLKAMLSHGNNTVQPVVVPLLDADATKANILHALARLSGAESGVVPPNQPTVLGAIGTAQPEDMVVVFFAGHGMANNGYYLIPYDLGYTGPRGTLQPKDLALLKEHSISAQELQDAFEGAAENDRSGIDASHILLIVDSCFSGNIVDMKDPRQGPMNSKGLAQLAYDKGMYILTAAQSYQVATESGSYGVGHGLLTHVLVDEGLSSSDADTDPHDGRLSVREWLEYAVRQVPIDQTDRAKDLTGRGTLIDTQTGQQLGIMQEHQKPRAFYRREENMPWILTSLGAN